jgi:NAD(P)-dependent dehydrogenase (short-subunit alcohol dehydrogenase family)
MSALFNITGKVALVTGGAQGMGRMIADALVRAGCKVYITSRQAEVCVGAAAEMNAFGDCIALPADLSSPEGVVDLAARFAALEPRLDVLINNAGKSWGAPIETFPDKAWPSVMAVNVQTPFTMVRELLPQLSAAGSHDDPARVINIGSVAGAVVEPIEAYSYAASKAAIHHLSRVLAADLAARNITVNVIVPGYFPTQMTSHIRDDNSQLDALQHRIPLGRLGAADDIGGLCIFLASRAGAYVTGAEIPLDGGLTGCR